jgi:hypothetical protein
MLLDRMNGLRETHARLDRPDRPFASTGIDEPTITALSAARKRVGADLPFLDERLPSPANLPDPATLLGWHRDLVTARSLPDAITYSEPLTRRVIARLGLEAAEKLASNLKGLAATTSALMEEPWARALAERQLKDSAAMSRVRPTTLVFLSEARDLVGERAAFVARPVSVPTELPPTPQRDNILQSFAEGKKPFGLLAFKLKPHKEVIGQIRVSGLPPAGPDDWRHVRTYVAFRDKVMSLSARWITLRGELSIPEDVHFSDGRP